MTPDEEEAYQLIQAESKARRKWEIQEHRRRANFDPMARTRAVAAAAAAAAASTMASSSPATTATGTTAAAAVAAPPLSAPMRQPRPLRPDSRTPAAAAAAASISNVNIAPRTPSMAASEQVTEAASRSVRERVSEYQAEEDQEEGEDDEELDDAAFEAAALSFLAREEAKEGQGARQGAAPPAAQARASAAKRSAPLHPVVQALRAEASSPPVAEMPRRTLIAPGSYRPGASLLSKGSQGRGGQGETSAGPQTAGAAQVGRLAPPSTAPLLPARPPRPPAASPGAVAAAAPLASSRPSSRLARIEREASRKTVTTAASEEEEEEEEEGEADEAEELDWETLAAGESFEKYLAEIERDEEDARVRRQRAEAARLRGSASSPAAPPRSAQARGSTVSEPQPPSPQKKRFAIAKEAESEQEDIGAELEQLLRLVEMMDGVGGGAGGPSAASFSSSSVARAGSSRLQASTTGGSSMQAGKPGAGAAPTAEDSIDWGVLEKMFLGEGWDDEIKELAAKAQEEQQREAGDIDNAMGNQYTSSSSSSSHASPNADLPFSWADEVTNLLLGLVGISHERYLDAPLLKAPLSTAPAAAGGAGEGEPKQMGEEGGVLSEEDRAAAYWEAPFALLVHDNSKEAMLEYCNAKALELIGQAHFDDIYDLSSFDVIDSSDAQQQEWLWAISEVEANATKSTLIPELRLRGRGEGGGSVLARNVLVFRLDNLEGELMGQAIVIREWERV